MEALDVAANTAQALSAAFQPPRHPLGIMVYERWLVRRRLNLADARRGEGPMKMRGA